MAGGFFNKAQPYEPPANCVLYGKEVEQPVRFIVIFKLY